MNEKTHAACKLHTTVEKTKDQIPSQGLLSHPPGVLNKSKISSCTPSHLSTFISAMPLRAPPGSKCPIYSFNLALRVSTVSCGPISDNLQKYDLMNQNHLLHKRN